jgi:hypothetical protein
MSDENESETKPALMRSQHVNRDDENGTGPTNVRPATSPGRALAVLARTARGLTATLVLAIGFAREIEGLQR